MIPLSAVSNPHKPAKPTAVEQLGLIASAIDVAVATVASGPGLQRWQEPQRRFANLPVY